VQRQLDVLGQQLEVTIRFAEAGFKNTELYDSVLGEKVMAHTLFSQDVNGVKTAMWFMRNESMPGHFATKAIAIDETTLYVETAPLNPQEIEPTITECALPINFSKKGGTFIDKNTMRPLVTVENAVTVKHDGVTFAPRCLWKADLTKLDSGERWAAIELIDAFFDQEAFDLTGMVQENELPQRAGQRQAPRTELRLQMQLLHQLRIEQRPLLVHSLQHQQTVTVEGRLELQTLLRLQQVILHMQPEQLVEFATQYTAEHGEAKAKSLFLFVLAGHVKSAAPNLSWKHARRVAGQIASHQSNQIRRS
jgi:hypothetical protein